MLKRRRKERERAKGKDEKGKKKEKEKEKEKHMQAAYMQASKLLLKANGFEFAFSFD